MKETTVRPVSLDSMPMDGDIARYLIINGDLNPHQLIGISPRGQVATNLDIIVFIEDEGRPRELAICEDQLSGLAIGRATLPGQSEVLCNEGSSGSKRQGQAAKSREKA